MRWVMLLTICFLFLGVLPSVYAYDLSQYPQLFVDGNTNEFNGLIIVGNTIPDTLAAADISTGIRLMGATISADKIAAAQDGGYSMTQPTIVIGCENIFALNLLDKTEAQECRDDISYEGVLLIREVNGFPVLFVLGSTDLGTRMAARVLMHYSSYTMPVELVHVTGDPLHPIITTDPPAPAVDGTLTASMYIVANVPSAQFDKTIDPVSGTEVIDVDYVFNLEQAGPVVGPIISDIGFAAMSMELNDLNEGGYIYNLEHEGFAPGVIAFEVTADQVVINAMDFVLPDRVLQDWLNNQEDNVQQSLTFSLAGTDITDVFGVMDVSLSIDDIHEDVNQYSVISQTTNGHIGDLFIDISLEEENIDIPNFDIQRNDFFGTIESSDGESLGGRMTVIVNDEVSNAFYQLGTYYINVRGTVGAPVKFFSWHQQIGETTIEATNDGREFNFVVDRSPDNYMDEDRDGIPDDLDECEATVAPPVDVRGCSCQQLQCSGGCTFIINEFSSNPVCAPTCFDNIQNQNEDDVDCGGPCNECLTCDTPNSCLEQQPQYCTSDKEIQNDCAQCGCPDEFLCETDGQCYKTVPLKHLQCKSNRYEFGQHLDCSQLDIPPINWWTDYTDRFGLTQQQGVDVLSELNQLFDQLDAEEFETEANTLLMEQYGLDQTDAGRIRSRFRNNYVQADEWFEERISDYVGVSVSGLPSFVKKRIKKKVEKELRTWNVCIKTQESCVLPDVECPMVEIVEEKKPVAAGIVRNEFNKQARHNIPRLFRFFGTKIKANVNLAPFQLEVESDVECEPARITPEQGCQQLIMNGNSESKADIVFIGDAFASENEFLDIVDGVLDYEGEFIDTDFEGLFSREPYLSNKEKFNIWTINTWGKINYERDDARQGWGDNPVPSDVYEVANACPHADYIILLARRSFRSFCFLEEGPCFVSVRGEEFPGRLVAHEVGHGFAGLTDEYYNLIEREDASDVVEELFQFTNAGLNCVPSMAEAQSLWGDLVADGGSIGYYQGCGGDCDQTCATFLRPTYNSIMRHQNENKDTAQQCGEGLIRWSDVCIGPPFDPYYAYNEREILKKLEQFN
jgi:hypothetical protein